MSPSFHLLGLAFLPLLFAEPAPAPVPAETEDPATAVLRAGCAKGDVESCWDLGPEARPRLDELLGARCTAGELDRCVELAHVDYTWPPFDVAGAFRLTGSACERGSQDGCRFHAQMLLNGEGTFPDVRGAISSLQGLCKKELSDACDALSEIGVYAAQGGPDAVVTAISKTNGLLASCTAGDGNACTTLGAWYDSGAWNLPKLETTAMSFLGRGCEAGSDLGCIELSRLLSYEDVARPVGLADEMGEKAMQRGCLAGEASLCSALADTFAWRAEDDSTFQARSTEMRQRACMAGDTESCDLLRAASLSERLPAETAVHTMADVIALNATACTESTNPVSCVWLVTAYQDGLWGTTPEPAKALDALDRACLAGSAEHCAAAGTLLQAGEAAPADPVRAIAAFEVGCSLDDGRSCLLLGQARADGMGVKKSTKKAKKLFAKACGLGESEGCGAQPGLVTASGCAFSTVVLDSDTGNPAIGTRCTGRVKIKAVDCPAECGIEIECGGVTLWQADGTCTPAEWENPFICADQIRECSFGFESGYDSLELDGGVLAGLFSAETGGVRVGAAE
jgi:TPR repeat protein